jgi:hypothetical protein
MKTTNLPGCSAHFLPGAKTFFLFFCLIFFSACQSKESKESKESAPMMEAITMDCSLPPSSDEKLIVKSGLTKMNSVSNESETGANHTAVSVKIPEKIKKTAVISLTIDKYKDARSLIEKIVKSGNGYIAGENEQNSTHGISNTMLIRVRNLDFERMVTNISSIPAHVNSKNIFTEDVTAEFVDITARLKSKKEVEKRYLELLQKAIKVTDILEIEEQLSTIREEIEAKEGQLKYLNDQVDYSTINLSFHQDFEFTPIDNPGFLGRTGTALGNGWNNLLAFFIGIINAWPFWLSVSIGGYFLYRVIKRKFVKK